jgi:general secretion pathway protein G
MLRVKQKRQSGMTLVELVVAIAIMAILATGVLPITRTVVKREREKELRAALWQMRDAIDRYKDAADRGAFQIKLGSEGYPPDLDTLVKGIDVQGVRCRTILRRIRGAGSRSSTCIQNQRVLRWTARSTQTGKRWE